MQDLRFIVLDQNCILKPHTRACLTKRAAGPTGQGRMRRPSPPRAPHPTGERAVGMFSSEKVYGKSGSLHCRPRAVHPVGTATSRTLGKTARFLKYNIINHEIIPTGQGRKRRVMTPTKALPACLAGETEMGVFPHIVCETEKLYTTANCVPWHSCNMISLAHRQLSFDC